MITVQIHIDKVTINAPLGQSCELAGILYREAENYFLLPMWSDILAFRLDYDIGRAGQYCIVNNVRFNVETGPRGDDPITLRVAAPQAYLNIKLMYKEVVPPMVGELTVGRSHLSFSLTHHAAMLVINRITKQHPNLEVRVVCEAEFPTAMCGTKADETLTGYAATKFFLSTLGLLQFMVREEERANRDLGEASPHEIRATIRELCCLIDDIHDEYIYNRDSDHPADCNYCAEVREARKVLRRVTNRDNDLIDKALAACEVLVEDIESLGVECNCLRSAGPVLDEVGACQGTCTFAHLREARAVLQAVKGESK